MQENQKRNMSSTERTIDLMRVFRVLLKRAWMILLIAVLCGVVVFGLSKLFIKPSYRSSFTAYVNNRMTTAEGQSNMTSSDITASRSLTYLYQEIILSRSVLLDAAADCGMDTTYAALLKNVSTSVATNAAIISVYVEADSPKEAEQLASAIAAVAPEHVARVVDGSSMRIVDYPVMPQSPYAPNSVHHAVMGFVIALLVCCIGVILFDVIVDKVASGAEIEDRYGIALVGMIPDMQQADKYQYSAASVTPRRK